MELYNFLKITPHYEHLTFFSFTPVVKNDVGLMANLEKTSLYLKVPNSCLI